MTASSFNFAPLDHTLGSRINVRGGGGKTTLARVMASKLGVPFIELDALSHLPDWVDRESEDFRRLTQEAIDAADESWVVDGNYSVDLADLVLKQADTIVWLDLPWRVMFRRILWRSFQRAWDKQAICGDNYESWRRIVSRNSLWWYYITHRRRIINRGQRFLPMVPEGVPVIRISSGRELNRFYEAQGLER